MPGVWPNIIDHTDAPQWVVAVLIEWNVEQPPVKAPIVSELVWLLNGQKSLQQFKENCNLKEHNREDLNPKEARQEILNMQLEDYRYDGIKLKDATAHDILDAFDEAIGEMKQEAVPVSALEKAPTPVEHGEAALEQTRKATKNKTEHPCAIDL